MRTQKYGIQIQRTKAEANKFDSENVNKLWQNTIDKEMTTTDVPLADHSPVPNGSISTAP